jgi:hypothetical protein
MHAAFVPNRVAPAVILRLGRRLRHSRIINRPVSVLAELLTTELVHENVDDIVSIN